MVPERIEREILINAPPEVVWSVVTEPDHLSGWFSDSVEIDLRPGGDAIFAWEEHPSARARIEKVEPPHYFSFRWIRRTGAEPREGDSTLVEFSLSAEGDGTRLRVVESGFTELEWSEEEKVRYASENERGWLLELEELREYVSKRVRGSTGR
jgi:uncharacterized protein YndB with AHSA1/START domain